MALKLVFSFMCLFVATSLADDITINISDGQVKGTQKWSYGGDPYYAFYSIKYAKAPTGSLRFQAPVAVDPWSGVYDATSEKNICYQVSVDSSDENEDCLSVNVYTPSNPSQISTKLPVLFYIHGGGFNWGSGQTKGATGGIEPEYFTDTNSVVMVSVNYRLGPFGFFSTGDTVIPGNAGLKDQVLALKWVQKNIANFGGDPNQVTIWGESAGGASVGYLLLSPSAKGLFRGAILSSGTSLCPWAYQRNQTEITYKTASFINSEFNTERDSQKLWAFLQTADAKAIDTASKSYTDWAQSYSETGFNGVINGQLQQGFFYAPVVEAANSNAFLTKRPYEALATGDFNQVPILIGTCADEGLMNYNQYMQWTFSVYDQNKDFLVPQGMKITNQQTKLLVGNAIKQEYSPNGDMQYNLLTGINYYTDQDFQKSLIMHAELQSHYTDVYFYVFSYSGTMGGNTNNRYPGTSNVTHTEEGNYLLQRSNPANFPQADQTVHQRLVRLWLNFITSLNPTPYQDALLQNVIWPKLQEGNLQYVDVGANLQTKTNPKDKYTFWKNLFQQYGVRPWESYSKGFFSTGDTVIPGNAGLKDQLLALKWVQKNIANFGGDPNKVTIWGESAGGASVGYLILSPSAKGLFRGAILSSGTLLCPWAYQKNQTEITYKTASFINSEFNTERDSQKLWSFLQTADAKAIDNASKNYSDWAQSYSETGFNGVINGQLNQGFFYAPVIEAENPNAYLTKRPYEAMATGDFNQVPILIGTCADEGLMNYDENLQWILSVYDQNKDFLVPQGMKITNQQTKLLVGNAIKQEYSPNSDMQDNLLSGINYFTDQEFQKSLIRHAELQSHYTDVYFYVFSYSGTMGGNTNNTYPGTSNVTHTEEGNYLFERSNPANYSQADQTVHQRFVRLWLNFITSLNPTPNQDSLLQNVTWSKLQEGNLQYLDIGENLQTKTNPKDKYTFWKALFEQYGVRPWESY